MFALKPAEQFAAQACRGVDFDVFFGPADSAPGAPRFVWERRALAICAQCPIRSACLTEALRFPADEQYGVVGGMTASERRAALTTPAALRGTTGGSASRLAGEVEAA
jgi:WhiB family redox-sensing transcriptional regulator